MQVAAGVQGHWGMAAGEVPVSIGGQHILLDMLRRHAEFIAEALAAVDQCRVVLQATQRAAAMRQATTQVAFAGAPVEPVLGRLGELQAAGEGLDLLPFAPGYVDAQARRGCSLGLLW